MNIELTTDDDTTQSPLVGPGSRLRIAREEVGLSVSQVASYLHLTSQLIRDIENDDYSRAPQAVFMRGYLRAYAKLVDISGDDLIIAYNELQALTKKKSNQNHQSTNLTYEIETSYKKRWLLALTLVIIPIVLILLLFTKTHTYLKTIVEQKLFPVTIVKKYEQPSVKSTINPQQVANSQRELLATLLFDEYK